MSQTPYEYHDGMAALYAADALTAVQTEEFNRHLAECTRCQQEIRELHEAAAMLSESEAVAPPPRLRSAILAQIADTPQHRPDRVVTLTTNDLSPTRSDEETTTTGSADVLPYPRHPRPAGWRRLPYLVAAVAIVLALAGGAWGWQTYHAAVAANRQAELVSRLVSAPDSVSRSAQMSGGGRGVVIVSRQDKQAIFVGTNLPQPTDNRVYQLWTINGTPQSAGLITSHHATVVVPLPLAALSATTVAITIEPRDGSSAPTTNPVMAFHLP